MNEPFLSGFLADGVPSADVVGGCFDIRQLSLGKESGIGTFLHRSHECRLWRRRLPLARRKELFVADKISASALRQSFDSLSLKSHASGPAERRVFGLRRPVHFLNFSGLGSFFHRWRLEGHAAFSRADKLQEVPFPLLSRFGFSRFVFSNLGFVCALENPTSLGYDGAKWAIVRNTRRRGHG